ncbi:hypothetical protein F5Y16DRAFT_418275 [Xylariaceae sp. FL0255]|nr:hypothetical protein F5Y16DRAFT_418275 [Xylariaceae sp. FL0255]
MRDPKEPPISTSFISHLRQASKVSCPYCSETIASIDERVRTHLSQKHGSIVQEKDLDQVVSEIKRGRKPTASPPGQDSNDDVRRKVASRVKPLRAQSTSPIRRTRACPKPGPSDDPLFPLRPTGKLWIPEQDTLGTKLSSRASRPSGRKRTDFADENSDALRLIKQPESRPISQEQLVAEVKGIYAGLVMVESKCIEVDNAQSSQTDTKLNNEHFAASQSASSTFGFEIRHAGEDVEARHSQLS